MDQRFTKERNKVCEDLMNEEARKLLDLPLSEKIKKSQEVIKEALEKYPKIGLGFSGGTDSLILMHLVLPFKQDIPVVFVDTQHEFPETYEYIKKIVKEWNVTNYNVAKAEQDKFEEFKNEHGVRTAKFTETCCNYHKIAPMMKAIGDFGFEAFFVGLRGVEHEERAKEVFFSPRTNPDHLRVHPLLFWTQEDVLEYMKQEDLPVNPLYGQGYTSLGCHHCTDKNTDPNAHERAGRGVVREEIMERLRELGYT
jgi:phosphoadenosine phosphosulfate reductase